MCVQINFPAEMRVALPNYFPVNVWRSLVRREHVHLANWTVIYQSSQQRRQVVREVLINSAALQNNGGEIKDKGARARRLATLICIIKVLTAESTAGECRVHLGRPEIRTAERQSANEAKIGLRFCRCHRWSSGWNAKPSVMEGRVH